MVNSQFAEEEPSTPNMRTISELEADLQQSEKTLSDLTTNFNALKKSQIELTELKHVLTFADQFLKVCLFITKAELPKVGIFFCTQFHLLGIYSISFTGNFY